jgi:putative membrane protein
VRHVPMRLGAAVAALVTLGACKDKTPDTDTLATAGVSTGATTAAVGATTATMPTTAYTDTSFVQWLDGVNMAETESIKLGREKATDPQVKAFANELSRDHQQMKTDISGLAKKVNVTLPHVTAKRDSAKTGMSASAVARADSAHPGMASDFYRESQEKLNDLRNKPKGKEFDEAWLEAQRDLHKDAIDKIEDAMGKTQNADMKTALQKALDGMKKHHAKADSLEKKFGV